ncbi:MAG: peptidylprolyl isomerase [Myxococcaceae bacterium]|nr:peptidylprolyl isomerase [Myxococcaceae bacterium]
MAAARAGTPLYATLHTNLGDIGLRLFSKDAPKTVENFVGLSTGEKAWTHPATHEVQHKPLYDGVTFHRVIPGFMIQGGDPLGEGYGGPGYKFEDEINNGHDFSKPGMLAMANAGPNTNGSQFFITVAPTQYLNNRHTIFGEVVSGYDVVEKISKVPRDPRNDKPTTPVVIRHIDITDKAPGPTKADHKITQKQK